jgi:2-keto-4-pentenoate hydratase
MARRRLEEHDHRAPGQVLRRDPGLTSSEAYELQGEVVRLRERRGERVVGFKVG